MSVSPCLKEGCQHRALTEYAGALFRGLDDAIACINATREAERYRAQNNPDKAREFFEHARRYEASARHELDEAIARGLEESMQPPSQFPQREAVATASTGPDSKSAPPPTSFLSHGAVVNTLCETCSARATYFASDLSGVHAFCENHGPGMYAGMVRPEGVNNLTPGVDVASVPGPGGESRALPNENPGWRCPTCGEPWAKDGAHTTCPPPF